jgi:hypothetical protein
MRGNQQDFFAGLMFSVAGGAFAWGARSYPIGTAARMGPGYFPQLLGLLLAGLGVIIALRAFMARGEGSGADGRIGAWGWRPLVFILLANLVFGACLGGLPAIGLPPLGLIAGVVLLTLVARLADGEFRLRETLMLAAVLAFMSWATFVLLLKLPLPVWPVF